MGLQRTFAGRVDKVMNGILQPIMPQITVLMAVYNGENWLDKSISSVLSQSYNNFEFIIVNDGSTDRTSDILEKYKNKDHRILVINKENTGPALSRNTGFSVAKGEWIAMLDADDICEQNRLQLQYECARSNPNAVLIGSGFYQIDQSDEVISTRKYPTRHANLLGRLIRKKAFFPHSSAFFRTETVRNLGGYRPRIARSEDYDLFLRLSEFGQICCIDAPLVRIRLHPGQISRDELGVTQFLDGRVALVSYFIRKSGKPDPVSDEFSDESFHIFRQFIKNETSTSGDDYYIININKLRTAFKNNNKNHYFMFSLILFMANHPLLSIKYIWRKFFGDYFPGALARRLAHSDGLIR